MFYAAIKKYPLECVFVYNFDFLSVSLFFHKFAAFLCEHARVVAVNVFFKT